MLLFPPVIKDKRTEPPMNERLFALVKRVAELCEAGLKACHCVEEFHLRRIRPLGHRERLAFECSRMAVPAANLLMVGFTFFLVINDLLALN
jgi:hypothetical protein